MFAKADKPMLYATLALFVGGLLILSSASLEISRKSFGTPFYFTLRQLLYGGLLGLIAFLITYSFHYRIWKRLAVFLMFLSFIFLALLFVPELGYSFGGARRWLEFGPLSFQPSEVLKFSFIVYLASWLNARRFETGTFAYGLAPFSLMLGVVAIFLIMQPDIGTLGVIAFTALVMFVLGGGKTHQVFSLLALGAILLYFIIQMAPYRVARITAFLDPAADPQGIGYQISQALIAIGSGGFWGLGFGKGIQKYSYLPEPMGDSVFAIFAEETGFVGGAALVAVFAFFVWRGFKIARRAPDAFGKLLASGLTAGIAAQVFINIAAISGLIPLTGIPLPFVSYGGTSLAMTLASVGVLLNISKNT